MSEKNVCFRLVQKNDCQMLWEWSNHYSIRQASFSTEPIIWESHVHWFNQKMQDPCCFYWIAINEDNIPIGQVRFDLEKIMAEEAIISVSVAPEYQGSGYGKSLIKSAICELFIKTSIQHVKAFVKIENIRSIYTFEKVGFYKVAEKRIKGQPSFVYFKSRH